MSASFKQPKLSAFEFFSLLEASIYETNMVALGCWKFRYREDFLILKSVKELVVNVRSPAMSPLSVLV